ncbi:hypothetical protein KY289_030127 [Solanum tuberosum]|nr:hypothetical protein KY289_030127 [Solanum tuberosum]
MTQTNVTTDQSALLSLKFQIISDPFHLLDESWSPAISVCHWVGVTCGSHHKRVTSLNISNMDLIGKIPSDFGNLTSLVSLDLSSNNFYGKLPQEMAHLRRLSFNGPITLSLFSNISTLQTLDLTYNSLDGQIPKEIGNLENLRLSGNKFIGSIPPSLSNASMLMTLELSLNFLGGNIPEEIGKLQNLKLLSIESNQLTGSIPFSIFNISGIEIIAFTNNTLSGNLPYDMCNCLPMLEMLYLSDNKLYGHMPVLVLNHNNLIGSFPREVGNLTELQILDLADNNLTGMREIQVTFNNVTGTLPLNIGSTLPNIEVIHLGNLNLYGTIPHSLSNCSKLTSLDLSLNRLTGMIPNSLGSLTHLQSLSLAINNLMGDSTLSFLTSLSNCRDLKILFLSLNPLYGVLPESIGNLSSTSLLRFRAIDCKIKGEIPKGIGNLSSLLELDLSRNGFTGPIPTTISNLRFLQSLKLSVNKLSGYIGDDLCKLQNLGYLNLTLNQLSGSLPNCLGNLTFLREMILGSNKLRSIIPKSLGNLINLLKLDLSSNNLGGSVPLEIGNLKAAIYMDLSINTLSNGIPKEIGSLQNLIYLSLRDNKLQGSIPGSMSSISALEFLDLSHNNVSGLIPKSLEKLLYLKYFNVSFNKLVGEIPSSGPFKNLSDESFMSNEALYTRGKRTDPQQAVDSSFVVSTKGRISYYELLRATDSLSEINLIGYGSFGSVYKGILRDGTFIAAKVFNPQLQVAFRSFDTECQVLRNLRHRNLTKVITSCSNLEFKALILEYMPNGSLDNWLYSHNYFLDIKHRLSIMIDVACALEYLHHGCSLPVIHCDMKPSNVLLDEDMVAHLSDFGISKLLSKDESSLYTKTLATFGYIAPEYGLEGLLSIKCDVYSYGIMLMETFTRKNPNDEMFDGDFSLKQWVRNSLPQAAMEIVDANLISPHDNHLMKKLDCVVSIMKVAIDCCVESPKGRIDMKDVVGRLKTIKIQLLAC